MQAAAQAAALAVQHDTAGNLREAIQFYSASAAGLREHGGGGAQAQAFLARAESYERRAEELRRQREVLGMPPPPIDTTATRAQQVQQQPATQGDDDLDLEGRLARLTGRSHHGPSDAELERRFAQVAGTPEPEPELEPEPEPRQITAAAAAAWECEQYKRLGIAGQPLDDVERLLSEAVASSRISHATGDIGYDDDDGDSGEVFSMIAAANDEARLDRKYGNATAPLPSAAPGTAAAPQIDRSNASATTSVHMGSAHGRATDSDSDSDDDVKPAVKHWLRSLGLGAFIDHIAVLATDMQECSWLTKDQVALLPLTAEQKQTLLVAVAKLPSD
jgi:hypothetical protein